MPDNVFYMRGRFPFERSISADLIADAKLLLELEVDQIKAIAAELEAYPEFLDRQSVLGIISRYVANEDHCKRLTKLVLEVDSRLRRTDQTIGDLVSNIRDWQQDEENPERELLSAEDMDELQRRLPLFIRTYPGLTRQAKARHLAEATGTPLESLEIICDLRPVFDEQRKVVEGVIPFTILKVVCKGVDGLPVSLEATLTELEVRDLAKRAAAAVEKLTRLRELLTEKKLTIPSLKMTKRGE